MISLVFYNLTLSLIFWILCAQSLLFGQEQMTGSFTDPRDGKTYKTIHIGGQWWMAENLNYETKEGSWCMESDANGSQYGRFYDWETAKVVAPPGWHLPSKQEFQTLLDSFGNNRKERYQQLILGGESGFDAILAGSYMGTYGKLGSSAHFWSSSRWWFSSLVRFTINPWRLCLRKEDSVSIGHFATGDCGFNVRCIKDE